MKRPTKPSHEPTIAELRELRERAWQKLRAAAIEAMAERKTKLEGRIDAGKKLSPRDQRELEEIRALLKRIELAKACALLSRIGVDHVQAALRQVAATRGNR